ncbi:MAG: hypothetical protein M3Y33_19835 [Actinomycetota bacterium]|nr:hypothetical protein [Actinomycetota bacterium]
MSRLIAAEFRKLLTTRLWLWILLVSVAWTILYTALVILLNNRTGELVPSLATAPGQHALFAIAAGGAGPLSPCWPWRKWQVSIGTVRPPRRSWPRRAAGG